MVPADLAKNARLPIVAASAAEHGSAQDLAGVVIHAGRRGLTSRARKRITPAAARLIRREQTINRGNQRAFRRVTLP